MLLQTASLFRRYFACTPNETFARLLPLGVRSFMAAHLKPLFEVLQLPLRLQNVLVFGGYNHDAENFAVIDYFLNHIHQSRNALETNSTQGSERVGWTTRVVSLAPRPNDVVRFQFFDSSYMDLTNLIDCCDSAIDAERSRFFASNSSAFPADIF